MNEEIDDNNTTTLAIKYWNKIWSRLIAEQSKIKDIFFHNLFSVILNEKKEDFRIHVLFVSDSASGKTEAVRLIEYILKEVGFNATVPSTMTSAGLEGSIDEHKHKQNIKYGLCELSPQDGKGHTYQDPVIKGDLVKKDWIGYEEAERILKPAEFSIQILLRQGMDKSRRIVKRLRLQEIPVETNTVFALCSYMIKEIKDTLLLQGLFQRMLIFIKNITPDNSRKIEQHIAKNLFTPEKPYDFKSDENTIKLIAELKKISTWYQKIKETDGFNGIVADKDYSDYVVKKGGEIIDSYKLAKKIDINILNSFYRRGIILVYRLAVHNAILHCRTTILQKDVDFAINIYKTSFDSVKNFICNMSISSKLRFGIVRILEQEGALELTKLIRKLNEQTGVGRQKIRGCMKMDLGDLIELTEGDYHSRLVSLKSDKNG